MTSIFGDWQELSNEQEGALDTANPFFVQARDMKTPIDDIYLLRLAGALHEQEGALDTANLFSSKRET